MIKHSPPQWAEWSQWYQPDPGWRLTFTVEHQPLHDLARMVGTYIISTYICIHIYIHVCIHIWCIYTCMYIHVYVYNMCILIECMFMYVLCTCTYVHVHIYIYIVCVSCRSLRWLDILFQDVPSRCHPSLLLAKKHGVQVNGWLADKAWIGNNIYRSIYLYIHTCVYIYAYNYQYCVYLCVYIYTRRILYMCVCVHTQRCNWSVTSGLYRFTTYKYPRYGHQ